MESNRNREEYIAAVRRGEIKLERTGMYWTDDEREQLRILYEFGEDITDLMIRFQRYENAILQQLTALHLLGSTQTPRERGPRTPRCKCQSCKMMDCIHCGKGGYYAREL